MAEHQDPSGFYDSMPWREEYGPGVAKDFRAPAFRNVVELIRRSGTDYAGKTAFTICLDNGLHASLRYHEVDALSDQFMGYLRDELGLEKGERVAIQMPNCLAYPLAVFGTLKAGCALVNINPLYTADEMHHQLSDSGAKVLVLLDLFADKLVTALEGTAVEKVLLVSVADFFPGLKRGLIKTVLKLKGQLPRPPVATEPFVDALAAGRKRLRDPASNQCVALGPDDLAALQYTGGTTGVAKGAELTHANLLANISQINAVAGPAIRRGEDTVLTALPLYHIFAFTFNLMIFYQMGCRNVLCPSPRPPSNLRKAFEKFTVNKFSGVNLLFHALCHEDWFRNKPPHLLNLSVAGGTALHKSTAEKWREVVGSQILQGYGLTETSPVVAVNPPMAENRLGTVGIPLPGTQVRVVGPDGTVLPGGEMGELLVKGPQVFRGYWNKPEETAQALRDGWFHTGDIAFVDERGYITIVDRLKDMIDVSGFNVYPNEVEEVIESLPGVLEVAVVGVPVPEGGERVRAYVVTGNPQLSPDDVIRYCREHLTGYKIPREVVFRSELPKSPVGKILRKDLRQEARAGKDG
ncbi:AMP-binding protein [Alkalilimnicola sp. S0819]|uniref:AMP-binding protein n=1 Tax=Alkalilimnicola sp. S0819 TaxID=2613922 RepID=UPI0012619C2E|nr:AMP-binding protein [Alkalilimnicola sp. S0819]KAB7628299.1 AMP-binding protein [Alkalilimnicola sp. S0819]MPQ15197.1 AMP-binding protein [Alkalilimnicola sp. S0819]